MGINSYFFKSLARPQQIG